MNSLGRRVITAAVLAPLAVAAVLGLETDLFRWVAAVVPLIAAWEWFRLSGISGGGATFAYLVLTAAYVGILGAVEAQGAAFYVGLPVALFWVFLTPVLMAWRTRPVGISSRPSIPVLLSGPLLLGGAWVALVAVHRINPGGAGLALFLLVLTWAADSAAYFTGRRFGRHKLAPAISPGKTFEGAWGGLVVAGIAALAYAGAWGKDLPFAGFVVLALLVAVVSVAGDLFESLIKRRHGVKDSGTLLPGHGGVLDRIDSLLAAAPVFYAGLWWLGVAG